MVCTSMGMIDTTILSNEVLDRVWINWLVHTGQFDKNYPSKRYKWVSRRSKISQEFENWLFTNGMAVQQTSGNRYMSVVDEQCAAFFLLKWSQ